jgi:hypothetical protein
MAVIPIGTHMLAMNAIAAPIDAGMPAAGIVVSTTYIQAWSFEEQSAGNRTMASNGLDLAGYAEIGGSAASSRKSKVTSGGKPQPSFLKARSYRDHDSGRPGPNELRMLRVRVGERLLEGPATWFRPKIRIKYVIDVLPT